MWGADFYLHVFFSERIVRIHFLALVLHTALHVTKTNPGPDCRTVGNGTNPAKAGIGEGIIEAFNDVGSAAQSSAFLGKLDTDQFWPVICNHAFPFRHWQPNVMFLGGHHCTKPHISGSRPAVQLITGNVALFNPHDTQSFGTVWNKPMFFTGLTNFVPHCFTVTPCNIYFKSHFAGKADPENSRCRTIPVEFPDAHERNILVGHVDCFAERILQNFSRFRSGDSNPTPLFCC